MWIFDAIASGFRWLTGQRHVERQDNLADFQAMNEHWDDLHDATVEELNYLRGELERLREREEVMRVAFEKRLRDLQEEWQRSRAKLIKQINVLTAENQRLKQKAGGT